MKLIKPFSRIKSCKYCGQYFIYNHNRETYCKNDCRDFARKEYKAQHEFQRRRKENYIKKERLGKSTLGPERKDNLLEELKVVHKEAMRIRNGGKLNRKMFELEWEQIRQTIRT